MQRKLPKLLPRLFAGAAAVIAAALFFGTLPSAAVGTAPTAEPAPTPSPTAVPSGAGVLPLNSSLLFVLDGPISSKTSRDGDEVRAHLQDALVLQGRTVAPAGTVGRIKIANVRGAKAPDVDGSVDIYFEPMTLPNNAALPLRAPTAHLSVEMTAGAASTAGITDTLKDIFVPYHTLYRLFRKGADIELRPGTVIRARTAAIVDATRPGIVTVINPPPFDLSSDAPAPHYKPLPFYTVPPKSTPSPKPTPAASPQPEPSTSP